MSSWKSRANGVSRLFLMVFGVIGAGWSIAYTWPTCAGLDIELSASSPADLLLALYWFMPLLLAAAAFLALAFTKMMYGVLWICSLFWLLLAVGEFLEGPDVQPGFLPVVFVGLAGALGFIHLVYLRISKD